MRGAHYLKSWSSTQKNVTLSSGEAELVAAVKASCELLGILQMSSEWGAAAEGEIFVDSTSAPAITARKGNGKMRHVQVGMFWTPAQAEEGSCDIAKSTAPSTPPTS